MRKKFFIQMVAELERAARRASGFPIDGAVQGQVRWGFGQPGLVGASLAIAWWVGGTG